MFFFLFDRSKERDCGFPLMKGEKKRKEAVEGRERKKKFIRQPLYFSNDVTTLVDIVSAFVYEDRHSFLLFSYGPQNLVFFFVTSQRVKVIILREIDSR